MEAKYIKEYGRAGGNKKPLPDHYDQNVELTTDFDDVHLAKGKWTSKGFYLYKESRIMQDFQGEGGIGINNIIGELKKDNVVIDDYPYYILKTDILLSSPSTAACLVHGNNRTGYRDWKHLEKTLGELVNMEEL